MLLSAHPVLSTALAISLLATSPQPAPTPPPAFPSTPIAVSSSSPPYPIGLSRDGRLRPCPSSTDCVSSSGREVTNRAMAPLSFSPTQRGAALSRAASLLRSTGAEVEVDEGRGYIHAVLPRPPPNFITEDLEILLIGGEEAGKGNNGVATFRDAARVKLPTPPWCLEKGCINGNKEQRKRVSDLAQELGWGPSDAGRMEDEGKWTPIFFNADPVPPDE